MKFPNNFETAEFLTSHYPPLPWSSRLRASSRSQDSVGWQQMIRIWLTKYPALRAKATAWQARNDANIFATNSDNARFATASRDRGSAKKATRHPKFPDAVP